MTVPSARHVILLVGPKGAGKSTIGRLLSRTYGCAHVEPEVLWIEHAAERGAYADDASFERAGFARVAAAVEHALAASAIVVTDTTAASERSAELVARLARAGTVHVVRFRAREATCRARIDARDAARQLPFDAALVARAHHRSEAARLEASTSVELDVERALPAPLFLLPALRAALAESGVLVTARAPVLTTERTVLRPWRDSDRAALAAMNADPVVAAQLVAPLSLAESDALFETVSAGFETYGFGPWALEVPGGHAFAGFCGLWVPTFEAPFLPAVEIAWRLSPSAWGHGYVTESARAVLAHAFDVLELPEVVSFTSPRNARSLAVMERLGMVRDPAGDFEHPRVPVGHRLRPHVLYRASRTAWNARRSAP